MIAIDIGDADLASLTAIVAAGAAGVAVRGCPRVDGLAAVGSRLAVAEAESGTPAGTVLTVAVIDRPGLLLDLGGLEALGPRLAMVALDPVALAQALGVDVRAAPIATARAMTVLAAAALGLPAALVGGTESDADADAAARDGFAARLVADPG